MGLSTVKQNSGHPDRLWHCGLRHASKGLHQGAWRLSVGTFGGIFTVSAIVGKTMRPAWLFLFVAARRNSLILKKMLESDRMQHRKLRLRGGRYQTESCPHPLNSRQPEETLSEKKWRTPCWVCGGHVQKDQKSTMHLPQLQKIGAAIKHVDKEKPIGDNLPSVVTDAGRRYSGKDTRCKKGIIGCGEKTKKNNRSQVQDKTKEERGRDCTFYRIQRLDHGRSEKN